MKTAAAILLLIVGAVHAESLVSGQVTNAEAAPVVGATVWLATFGEVKTTTTDEDGKFEFAEVQAGEFSLVVYSAGQGIGGLTTTLVDDLEVKIALRPAIDTPLRTVDPRMRPIEGARLAKIRINDAVEVPAARLADFGLPSIRSDAEGWLTIPFLASGDVARIEIDHRSYAKEVLPTLPAGTELDAVLPFGETVRGRVLQPDGGPAANAAVAVFVARAGRAVPMGDAVADGDGFYSVVVPAGNYYVTAKHPQFGMPKPVLISVEIEQETLVSDLVLTPTTLVSGAALDEENRGVPGVRVRYVHGQLVVANSVTDSTGRYTIRVNRGAGELRFEAPAKRAILGAAHIELSVADEKPLLMPAIIVADLPTITGSIQIDGSEALDQVLVATTNLAKNVFVRPDSEGRFSFALEEFPHEGVLSLRAEHAQRFLRGETQFHVFNDPEPRISLQEFQPNLAPAAEGPANALAARVGKDAPELECVEWFNAAEPVSLAALKGKVVVLTLWASFDESSRAQNRMNELERWRELYSDGTVAFVVVHEGTTASEQVQSAIAKWGIGCPVGRDTEEFETFDRYSTNFVPQTVLIDRTGVLRYYEVDGRIGELIKDLRRR